MDERGRRARRRGARAGALVLALALCPRVSAQHGPGSEGRSEPRSEPKSAPRSETWAPEDILPLADFEDDPIGVDANPVAPPAPPPAKPEMLDDGFGPRPPAFRAQVGEVLTGVPALRESSHAIHVRFADGLAHVRVRMRIESTAKDPAEVHYRIAVPPGAVEAGLEVCNHAGCRVAVREPSTQGYRGAYDAAIRARRAEGQDRPVLPVAHLAADGADDVGAAALLVRAAPVAKGEPLDLTVDFAAPAPVRGGVARLSLPARGMDARAAMAELTLEADDLLDPRIDGAPADAVAAARDPWVGAELSARAAPGGVSTSAVHFDCGTARCARLRVVAGSAPPRARELWIALDVSPSMVGPARGRVGAAMLELLSSAPPDTRVRALAFAGEARTLIAEAQRPDQVALSTFARAAAAAELGAATRFEAAWPTLAAWAAARDTGAPRPLVVVLGDGGLTTGARDPFGHARAEGVEVSVVNLADRPTAPALRDGALSTGGTVIDVGVAARRAARGRGGEHLREQLAALFAPTRAPSVQVATGQRGQRVQLPPVRAGEEVLWQGAVRRRGQLVVHGTARSSRAARQAHVRALGTAIARARGIEGAGGGLVAVHPDDLAAAAADWPAPPPAGPVRRDRKKPACDGRGPGVRAGGLSSDTTPLALAHRGSCEPAKQQPAKPTLGRGMPAEPLLGMLRDRIIPVARGCFRRDRAGRPDYSVRAVFEFHLAQREIVDAKVEGAIEDSLRRCLLRAVDRLEIPRFSGKIVVRYPLYTAREQASPRIELSSEAAAELDALMAPGEADSIP